MKKTLLIFVLTLFTTLLFAQVSKTINVATPGTLNTLLSIDEKWSITSLTLTGYIDARDVKCLRDEIRNLSILDLSSVTINEYNGNSGTSSYMTSYPANSLPGQSFWSIDTGAKTSLITVYLPNNLNVISSQAFSDCIGLKSITIPNSVTSIENNAFSSCNGLTSITIPNSVHTIGNASFSGCRGLTYLTIGNSVTILEDMSFMFCTNLTSVVIPDSVKKIGSLAFYNCNKLTKISIPNNVESVGESAFQNCSDLSSLTIGSMVSTIGNYAFQGCVSLKTIHSLSIIPPILGSNVFYNSYLSVTNVYVSTLSVDTYKSATGWFYYFYPIISADSTLVGVKKPINRQLSVNTTTSRIIIDGTTEGEIVTLYTLSGKHLQTVVSNGERLNLSADKNEVYLLKTGEKTFKVIL